MFGDEYDNDGSVSGSLGTCNFPFCSDKPVGIVEKSVCGVSGVGFGVFVPTGIESIDDVVLLSVFVPRVVESKSSRLIELFLRPKSCFSLLVSKSVLAL